MKLSTRGRYAVMALLDLAVLQKEKGGNTPVSLAEVAQRQDISLSYLEQIFAALRRCKVVRSVRGPGGGYLLEQAADRTYLSEVVKAVNEPVRLARCSDASGRLSSDCMKGGRQCNAHRLWEALGHHIEWFLENVSLEMVLNNKVNLDFCGNLSRTPNTLSAGEPRAHVS